MSIPKPEMHTLPGIIHDVHSDEEEIEFESFLPKSKQPQKWMTHTESCTREDELIDEINRTMDQLVQHIEKTRYSLLAKVEGSRKHSKLPASPRSKSLGVLDSSRSKPTSSRRRKSATGLSTWVHLNVGGTLFVVQRSLLCVEPDCMLAALVSGSASEIVQTDDSGSITIERDPSLFKHILQYLRQRSNNENPLPFLFIRNDPQVALELRREADFYNLKELKRLLLLSQGLVVLPQVMSDAVVQRCEGVYFSLMEAMKASKSGDVIALWAGHHTLDGKWELPENVRVEGYSDSSQVVLEMNAQSGLTLKNGSQISDLTIIQYRHSSPQSIPLLSTSGNVEIRNVVLSSKVRTEFQHLYTSHQFDPKLLGLHVLYGKATISNCLFEKSPVKIGENKYGSTLQVKLTDSKIVGGEVGLTIVWEPTTVVSVACSNVTITGTHSSGVETYLSRDAQIFGQCTLNMTNCEVANAGNGIRIRNTSVAFSADKCRIHSNDGWGALADRSLHSALKSQNQFHDNKLGNVGPM